MFDLDKARKLMEMYNIDGLIVTSPENFYYVTGYDGIVFLGKTGTSTAIIPKAEDQDPAIVIMDWEEERVRERTWIKDIRTFETWIHFDRKRMPHLQSSSKPEQFDPVHVISETIKEKGLEKGNLGVEMESIPLAYYQRIKATIKYAHFLDSSGLFLELRAIKDLTEIEKFRKGIAITEKGIMTAVKIAKEGVAERDIAKEFRRVIAESDCWKPEHIQVAGGANSSLPHLTFMDSSSYMLKNGDFLRLDVGVNFQGIITDMCRTYVIGKPSEGQKRLYNALLRGQRKVVQNMKPGAKFSDLFKIGLKTVRDAGFSHYTRGHLGHSISYGPFAEEPPFISLTERKSLEPGMVLCVEVPYYIIGVGGINIEDVVLITKDGYEELTTLDRELISLG